MYEIIKDVIKNRNYELQELIYKIDKMYIEEKLTEEQRDELLNLARSNANAENSYAPLQERVEKNSMDILKLKERLDKLEKEETEPEPIEEYPEYKQPTGSHDSYIIGDKVTFKGKKYICKMNGCVWSPEVYPSAWEEVIEMTEIEESEPIEGTEEEI